MLGADFDIEEIEVPQVIENGVGEELRDDRSFASFVGAINYSTARLAESLAQESEDAVEADIIDVAQARKMGILPIAFQNGEEFVWYEYSEDGEYEEESGDDAEYEAELEEDEEEWSDEEESDDEEAYEEGYDEDEDEEEWDESEDEDSEEYEDASADE
jgi:hypothetical protein